MGGIPKAAALPPFPFLGVGKGSTQHSKSLPLQVLKWPSPFSPQPTTNGLLQYANCFLFHPLYRAGNKLAQCHLGTLDEYKAAGKGGKTVWSDAVIVNSEGKIQGRTLGVENQRNPGGTERALVCLCVHVSVRVRSRLNHYSLSLQARLLGVPGQTAFPSGPIPASAGLQVRTVPGDLGGSGRHSGSSLLHVLPRVNAGDLIRMEDSSRGWAVPPAAQSMVSSGKAGGGAHPVDWTICTD